VSVRDDALRHILKEFRPRQRGPPRVLARYRPHTSRGRAAIPARAARPTGALRL